jgi:hypothetical protein
MRKTLLLTLLMFICPLLAHSQAVAYHDISWYNSSGTLRVAASATITVCSGTVVVIPCTPPVVVFSDFGLTQPINNLKSDVNGNYGFFANAGNYVVNVSGATIQTYGYVITLGASSGGVSGGITNYVLTATGATTNAFNALGIPLGNGGAVITTCGPYVVRADTTTTLDRGTALEFNSAGACSVTLPDPSTSGMTSNYAVLFRNVGTGAVTVTRGTSSTFSVITGSATGSSFGGTSFTMAQYQYATCFGDNASTWRCDENTGGVGGGMVWPTTPGIAVCTGTPCTAWTTSLTPPPVNTTTSTSTSAIAANTCVAQTAITLTGATTSMVVDFTPTSDVSTVTGWGSPSASLLYMTAYVSGANTISWKVCNNTSSSITPGSSVTWNVGAR